MFCANLAIELFKNKHIFKLVKMKLSTNNLSFKMQKVLTPPFAFLQFNKYCYSSAPKPGKKISYTTPSEKGFADAISVQEELVLDLVKRGKSLTNKEIEHFKTQVLNKGKFLTSENIDSKFLSLCAVEKALDVGRSYFFYIRNNKYNLAGVGKFFQLCFNCQDLCTNEDKKLIVDLYKELISKYNILDSITCENALKALSITPAWKEALPLIEMCKLADEPTSKMYDAIIVAAFKNEENEMGWMLVEKAIQNNKTLSLETYHCISKEDKNINFLLALLEKYDVRISPEIAELLIKNYKRTNSNGLPKISAITRKGHCLNCSKALKTVHLSEIEFQELKNQFLNAVLIGKDVFLKTKPSELKSFTDFIKAIGRIDIVLDGLNTAYIGKKRNSTYSDASSKVRMVVDYFAKSHKKVLVIGRKHMNNWPKKDWEVIKKNSFLFLTDNVSSDDPFVLYAALTGGLGTIFISRDQMRGHKFLLKEPKLRAIFVKWQQIHQYYLKSIMLDGQIILVNPLPYLQSVQSTKDGSWHLPLKCNNDVKAGVPGHLVPQITSWLCLP